MLPSNKSNVSNVRASTACSATIFLLFEVRMLAAMLEVQPTVEKRINPFYVFVENATVVTEFWEIDNPIVGTIDITIVRRRTEITIEFRPEERFLKPIVQQVFSRPVNLPPAPKNVRKVWEVYPYLDPHFSMMTPHLLA